MLAATERSIALLSIFALVFLTNSDPTFLYSVCPKDMNSKNSTLYQSHVKTVLSSLASNATKDFYNTSAKGGQSDVYGMYLCRGDVTTAICRDCVTYANRDMSKRCSERRVAIIWYDQCLLRYSNVSIFSIVSDRPSISMSNTEEIAPRDPFDKTVMAAMEDVATKAANATSAAKKFAVKETNFTGQKIYSLAQCTPDLSKGDCTRCLSTAVAKLPDCCSGKKGGRILSPSCNIRYELYPFYGAAATRTSSMLSPPGSSGKKHVSKILIIAIVAPICASSMLFFITYWFLFRRGRGSYTTFDDKNDLTFGSDITLESLQFDLSSVESATNNFSIDNKLGEGGFGEVFEGTLANGRKIAVKRLSRSSGQGAEEFKNEVMLIAKLQHRNLVRVLGFCVEEGEKILIYEFAPNKSLDYFLFDQEKQAQLDWSRRYKLIGGIARGILYLHQDSQFRIIHRDLKASNILLDEDMDPKISDFGMAKIFEVDQTQGNTKRIVGTYGYMSPEYAMHGHFSVKSDVYSFGVLILEIISGKRNTSFCQEGGARDLVSYVWKNWVEGTPLDALDPTLSSTYSRDEALRCIHIGLLCVQEDPTDRPSMETIMLVLNSYSTTLPAPQQPAFAFHIYRSGQSSSDNKSESDQYRNRASLWSVNHASISEVYPR